MEIDFLKRILFRWLLGRENEREREQLNNWLSESEANKKLLDRLKSKSFLQQVVGDQNKGLRQQEWKKLQTLTIGHRKTIGWVLFKRIAVFVLPLVVGSVIWISLNKEEASSFVLSEAEVRKVVLFLQDGRKVALDDNGSSVVMEKLGEGIVFEEKGLNYTRSKSTNELEYHLIKIPRGGGYSLVLADGSRVFLNAASQLKFPVVFAENERRVYLEGEAYFDVVQDKGKSFIVEAGGVEIQVLGTEFDVRAYSEEEEVLTTLVEGKVRIAVDETNVALLPSEQAVWIPSKEKMEVKQVDVERFIGWKNGRWVFNKTPIWQIMNELCRWYDLKVEYSNEESKYENFSLNIERYDDFKQILGLLEETGNVRFALSENTVIVY